MERQGRGKNRRLRELGISRTRIIGGGAIRGFVEFYNYRRYHKALKDVTTPADVLEGHSDAIIVRRKEVQRIL